MTYQKATLLLLVLLCGRLVFGQERTIKGTITDDNTKTPLAGVTVKIRGSNTATSTNSAGEFAIRAQSNTVTLVVSSVGFSTKEVVVGEGSGNVSISMVNNSQQLGEVVVTALGITRQEKTLVYATQTVKPAELTGVRDANNVLNSLQGKVANAVITQGSGGPGSGARIVNRIRKRD